MNVASRVQTDAMIVDRTVTVSRTKVREPASRAGTSSAPLLTSLATPRSSAQHQWQSMRHQAQTRATTSLVNWRRVLKAPRPAKGVRVVIARAVIAAPEVSAPSKVIARNARCVTVNQ